jgi:hypothetical protein
MLQTIGHFEISCLRVPFSQLEKQRNHVGARFELNSVFGLEKEDQWKPVSSDLAPRDFWAFPIMKRELQGKKFQSD